jgi:hypothetical protein
MKPKSETLFHFTKSLDTLQAILRFGYWPRYCLEDIEWLREEPSDSGFVSFPVVCFCDIPLSRVDEHVLFYGEYGLGMTKEWALRNGLSPIHYVPPSGPFTETFKALGQLAAADFTADREALRKICLLAMYMKPLTGSMTVSGSPVVKNFYQESEWRFVAKSDDISFFLTSDEHANADKLRAANEKTRTQCMLRFLPSDVRYLFVRSDSDIPALMNFIQVDLDHYPAADLKILMSRVASLESIGRDW